MSQSNIQPTTTNYTKFLSYYGVRAEFFPNASKESKSEEDCRAAVRAGATRAVISGQERMGAGLLT